MSDLMKALNSKIADKYKKSNPMMVRDPSKMVVVHAISSGCVTVDLASGFGGLLAKGHVAEIVGANTSGKTTICIQTCVQAQRAGENVVYIDAEGVFDIAYARALGLDTDADSFSLYQPDYGEQIEDILDMFDEAIRASKGKLSIGVIIIDSIATARPEEELKGNKRIGQHASMWARIAYKIKNYAKNHNIAFGMINQLRAAPSISSGFSVPGVLDSSQNNDGGSEDTTGGNTLKFLFSIRWQFKGFSQIKESVEDTMTGEDAELRVGNTVNVTTIKNKLAVPMIKTKMSIVYGKGTVDYYVLEEIMKARNLITNSGTYKRYIPLDPALIPNPEHETYPGYIYGKGKFDDWWRSDAIQADAAKQLRAIVKKAAEGAVVNEDGELDAGSEVDSDALNFTIEVGTEETA